MQKQGTHPNAPDHFELKGSYFLLTYHISPIDGESSLIQQIPGQNIFRMFNSDRLNIHHSMLGTQITVTLETIPDFMATLLTVFIPSIQVRENTVHKFKTIAIVTKVRPDFKAEVPAYGVAQSYLTYTLEGKAQKQLKKKDDGA